MSQALIGTVHSVCERLLKRFAFELGLSPELNVLGIEDHRLFHQALDEVTDLDTVRTMNALAARLETGRWQEHVEKIAERARDNDIDGDALRAMGTDSARALLEFFPPRSARRPSRGVAAGDRLRARDDRSGVRLDQDHARISRAVADREQRAARRRLSVVRLGVAEHEGGRRKKATRRRRGCARRRRCTRCIPIFTPTCTATSKASTQSPRKTLGRSQALKTERGLIDFSDMEQLTLRAVDNPHVRECLEDELDLLLVDEFQDTDPMQLALFVKLARLAKRVIFVGDVKQSIYAFRGCDPELVDATLADLKRRGAKTDVLQSSWRARPQLLGYLNQLFVDAFAADGIDAGRGRAARAAQEPGRYARGAAVALGRRSGGPVRRVVARHCETGCGRNARRRSGNEASRARCASATSPCSRGPPITSKRSRSR